MLHEPHVPGAGVDAFRRRPGPSNSPTDVQAQGPGHTASKWENGTLNPGGLRPEPLSLTTPLALLLRTQEEPRCLLQYECFSKNAPGAVLPSFLKSHGAGWGKGCVGTRPPLNGKDCAYQINGRGRIGRVGSAGVLPGESRVEADGGGNPTDLSEQAV